MNITKKILNLRLFLYRLEKIWIKWRGTSKQIYFGDRIKEYHDIWQAIAETIDARFEEITSDIWCINKDGHRIHIRNYQLPLDNPVVLGLAGSKQLIHRMLADERIAVPDHLVFTLDTLEKAHIFLRHHPGGIVIKPARGFGGKGVTTNITTAKQIREAAVLAALYSKELLAEKQIAGECFRLLVFNGKLLHAVKRKGTWVTGDGCSTIADLVYQQSGRSPADMKSDIRFTLLYQGISMDTILPEGRMVLAGSRSSTDDGFKELRTVYDTDVTADVCPQVKAAAEKAADIVGSAFLGVDIITVNISKDLHETGGTVNEVNTTPALHHHYNAALEQYPQPALTIIKTLIGIVGGEESA